MNYIDLATQVLKKIITYDPRMSNPDEGQVMAWAEHLELNRLTDPADLMHAVTMVFNENDAGDMNFRVTPKMISSMAKKIRRERFERSDLDSDQRRRIEAACNAKAEPEAQPALPPAPADLRDPFQLREKLRELAESKSLPVESADQAFIRMVGTEQRKAAPPAPLACPDCGSIAVPCPCDEVTQ